MGQANSHIAALSKRHEALEMKIEAETHRPHPDDVRLHELKKQKLKLKDTIYAH
ncbi:DUF465 domain-containing protein [Pacificimonas sp. WHA3]|uniref:DUF465 domain-containing protein n=1 Tax=Pacificimonas pallii TaxID=2827236 RepID=A0ABS6SCS9_9SPHN|nr:DUF465 domain-containing protein [Pacificimonas pallii]MBV7256220.1 DUF465 domain-containing protein [Pacificimonas pallii]